MTDWRLLLVSQTLIAGILVSTCRCLLYSYSWAMGPINDSDCVAKGLWDNASNLLFDSVASILQGVQCTTSNYLPRLHHSYSTRMIPESNQEVTYKATSNRP
jgi:hypothetical protein